MHKRWGMGLILMGLGLLLLVLWIARRPTPTPPGVVEVNGRIEGDQAAVGAKIGGKIVHLAVGEGDRLERGTLIAALASDQVQAQLEQAAHTLHTAREQIATAEARVVSMQRQIDAAQTAVTLAERESLARIGEAQAALGAAQAQWHQATADLEKVAKDYARAGTLRQKGDLCPAIRRCEGGRSCGQSSRGHRPRTHYAGGTDARGGPGFAAQR